MKSINLFRDLASFTDTSAHPKHIAEQYINIEGGYAYATDGISAIKLATELPDLSIDPHTLKPMPANVSYPDVNGSVFNRPFKGDVLTNIDVASLYTAVYQANKAPKTTNKLLHLVSDKNAVALYQVETLNPVATDMATPVWSTSELDNINVYFDGRLLIKSLKLLKSLAIDHVNMFIEGPYKPIELKPAAENDTDVAVVFCPTRVGA